MKICIFGASGMVGSRVVQEALSRGHSVTAVLRDPSKVTLEHPDLKVVQGNVMSESDVSRIAKGHDCVVSAIRSEDKPGGSDVTLAAQALVKGLKEAGISRLIVVGGAGMLNDGNGALVCDAPGFPEKVRRGSLKHFDALKEYRASELDWSVLSPAYSLAPGERTGTFRLGVDQIIRNAEGESRISAEDYAIAMVDEIERSQYVRQNFTLAY